MNYRTAKRCVAVLGVAVFSVPAVGISSFGRQARAVAGATIEHATHFPYQNAAYDRLVHVAVAPDGSMWMVGTTDRDDLPVTADAYDKTFGGLTDVFVAKVAPDGTVAYATYLGGDFGIAGNQEFAGGVAVDGDGYAYVVGTTNSENFPIVGEPFQGELNRGGLTGTPDMFLAKFDATGALVYSTFIGGRFSESLVPPPIGDVAVDGSGNIFVVGQTTSDDFPVVNAMRPVLNDGEGIVRTDAFVVKFNAALQVEYATYLGGPAADYGWRVAGDGTGAAYVLGHSEGSFPVTAGALRTTPPQGFANSNTWLAKLSPNGSSLGYATYISGVVEGGNPDLAVDAAGQAFVSGQVFFDDVPITPGAFQTTRLGQTDMFLMKLTPSGGDLVYSTYLGGNGVDLTLGGLAVDATGNAYVAAEIQSGNFPFVNEFAERQTGGTLIKVNPEGSGLLYASGLGADFGAATAVAVGLEGEVAVGGTWRSTNGFYNDAAVLRIVETVPCVGDCHADGKTTVDDVMVLINIELGSATPDACPGFEQTADGTQAIRAVSASLAGCG